jgi:superoxide dismutase, Fe-Mn family
MKHTRREFIRTSALAAAAGIVLTQTGNVFAENILHGDAFTLPALPYDYAALEPFIDGQTMELHHGMHHAGYVANVNKAIAPMHLHGITIDELCKNISRYEITVRNNGGGHYNHSLFWQMMKPKGEGQPGGKVAEALNASFGSFDAFKTSFTEAAMKRFGSGWAWLVKGADGKLAIGSTPNQDNPIMDVAEFKGKPLLALDVWEHAYYLKYQNKRADYINSFWNIVNWEEVAKRMG